MKYNYLFLPLVPILICSTLQAQPAVSFREKTAFQTGSPWIPQIDTRADIAIVYGVSERGRPDFEKRVQSWRDRGYRVQFMTGIAWGQYDDYFLGKWDGKNHLGEGQITRNGDTIWHGHNIPYIVPTDSYIKFMQEGVVKRVIDAGIDAIYLEEPEFWARGGYGEVFANEWQRYYGFPWRPQHESAENTYLSSKLKYHLYYNTIRQVSDYAKAYGKSKGRDVKVYIPTHSLVNYSSWEIVSPEASLASLPGIDGYIAQVWTGTSREPTYFHGLYKERVFENAFLEYGSMVSMTAPTKRKLFFLTDPIEDRPRDWSDFKRNYEATFTAQLLYPTVADYEVMPWPERIYTHRYRVAHSDTSVLIPRYYSTQMQIMINVLNDIKTSHNRVSGPPGIGVLMGNSLMFQRFPTHEGYSDPAFSNFYGQTMPLVKRGIPVETVHMENLSYPATLKNIRVLVMSYSNMKPLSADVHRAIADWVSKGGTLVYCGRDDDPYQKVMEWWNTGDNHFAAPSEHLFRLMHITPTGSDQQQAVGRGKVFIIRENPKEFVMQPAGDSGYINVLKQAYGRAGGTGIRYDYRFYLKRGPYDIVAVLDENQGTPPEHVKGPLIDLFDPKLPVLAEKTVQPGTQALLYMLSRITGKTKPQVLASAARVYDSTRSGRTFSFLTKAPVATRNSMRILLPAAPSKARVTDQNGQPLSDVETSWDAVSHTCYLGFDNSPEGVRVELTW
ncbi:MAG: hypothetical protein JST39_23970 [Bacteroidetes bacterium]|nr:hypothetical protein [Bacteroidota bacterium]